MRRLSSLILPLLLLTAAWAPAQDGRTVTLITVGPGDAIWEQFGHNILCISDNRTGVALCYDWGRFDFDEPGFVPRFVQGKMTYSMGGMRAQMVSGLPHNLMLDDYRAQKRHIVYQRLPLTEPQISDLLERCRVNYLPENQKYRYDYFLDNCSTRVRDMLDVVTQGQVRRTLDASPTLVPMTYRQHTTRLMQGDLLLSLGVDFALGPACDRVLSAWEESFLPTRFATYMASLSLDTQTDPSPRPPEPTAPPDRRLPLAIAGVLLGGLIAATATSQRKTLQRVSGAMVVAWWVVGTVGASFMLYLWGFTDHTAGYANQNLLHFSPVALGLLGVLIYRRVRRLSAASTRGLTRALAGLALAISAIGLTLQLTGILTQANLHFILLALPLHLSAGFAVLRLTADPPTDQLTAP